MQLFSVKRNLQKTRLNSSSSQEKNKNKKLQIRPYFLFFFFFLLDRFTWWLTTIKRYKHRVKHEKEQFFVSGLQEIIYAIYSPAGTESVWGKSEVLNTPRGGPQAEGTVFPYTTRPKPVNNIFIFICFYFPEDERELVCFSSRHGHQY